MTGTDIRVVVTGATGFLGRRALAALAVRPGVAAIAACRSPQRLDRPGGIEVRCGDVRDDAYRRALVRDADVIVHAGTWSALWDHATQERTHFYEPARALMEASIEAGVRRFILPSTVAIARPAAANGPVGDDAPTAHTGFWPHLDRLVDLDNEMRAASDRGTEMVTLRLGHFVGAGLTTGLVEVLASRLRTHLVPWLAGGRARMPLIADTDLGEALALAAVAEDLAPYESLNICGPEFPTAREVIGFIADQGGLPRPRYTVPFPAGHAFGWLAERGKALGPSRTPFLTRSIVHLSRDWSCTTDRATAKLGYVGRAPWRDAVAAALARLRARGYPAPAMAQTV